MKVFTNTSCKGHYPVGFAAVVVAKDKEQAAEILNDVLVLNGLLPSAKVEDFVHVKTSKPDAIILNNGDY